MASFQPTFTGQVGSNPRAVWQSQAQQPAAPGIPASIHSASVTKRRRRRSARTAVQQSRGYETRASAADTKGQRSLASGAPQKQPLFAFQDESIQLPRGQEDNALLDGQQNFDFTGSVGQPFEQAAGGIFDNNSYMTAHNSQKSLRALNDKLTSLERTLNHKMTYLEQHIVRMTRMENSIPEVTGERVVSVVMNSITAMVNNMPLQTAAPTE
ncbi:hypothetical protein B0T10DRAFT_467523 [Thelonectria olida]|uniref:Uncharacterized protein n=1 Tax=Thelonectria olida TaxID=1576542 RepID=A0A9P8VPT1_9HYPO|nr:hypothetical protein B0T10DRAFT_467523 [Thelonectria olida]